MRHRKRRMKKKRKKKKKRVKEREKEMIRKKRILKKTRMMQSQKNQISQGNRIKQIKQENQIKQVNLIRLQRKKTRSPKMINNQRILPQKSQSQNRFQGSILKTMEMTQMLFLKFKLKSRSGSMMEIQDLIKKTKNPNPQILCFYK